MTTNKIKELRERANSLEDQRIENAYDPEKWNKHYHAGCGCGVLWAGPGCGYYVSHRPGCTVLLLREAANELERNA